MSDSKKSYITHEKDGLLFLRGKLPQGGVRAFMDDIAAKGYTSACSDLATHFKCTFVGGSVGAINKARRNINLPPLMR
ncbi:hypothetical protein [Pseudoalteromonas marina]|uniref:Uncharacterized protein n=1 Tax=Pseudoalteromonas marina TaxID=267375 RepID=A0ABT9FGE3_9GAMM|nr:hypothetical protein [Pseudoalteromonas marina]MDP2565852.1 hypothetical protein [Pseudoalteromonas marina]